MEQQKPKDLAHVAIRGTIWVYLSNYSGKLMVFLSTVILARLLMKEDFGVAGYALVIIGFLDVLSDLGIGAALIYYREKPGSSDTAFWLGLAIGVGLFIITWVVAPFAGMFFNDARAVGVTRLLGLTFPISALGNVHSTLLTKRLDFKRKFVPEFAGATSKGIVSVVLALLGFGAWSLIIGQLSGTVVQVIANWWALPWWPSFRFVRKLARPLLTYGINIVMVNGLGVLLLNADYLFVGRYLGAAALGAYILAFRVPELLIKQFCGIVGKVIFPVFAKMRDDPAALSRGFLLTMRYVTMITFPMALGLALVAEPFVLTIFGEKWAEAIPVMPAIAIYTLLRSLNFNVGDIYKAQGRPGVLTQMSLFRTLILIPALWWAVTYPGTIAAVGWTQAAVAFVGGALGLVVAARLLNTPLSAIGAALRPATIGGTFMSLAVMGTLLLLDGAAPVVRLLAGVVVGGLVYGGALWLLQRDVVVSAGHTLRGALQRR